MEQYQIIVFSFNFENKQTWKEYFWRSHIACFACKRSLKAYKVKKNFFLKDLWDVHKNIHSLEFSN